MRLNLRNIGVPLFSLLFGLLAALVLVDMLGESPDKVLLILLKGAFGSMTAIGYSLYYATPLLLTGLSVACAFQAGLFNIGVEGQMAMGGLTLAAVGILAPNLPPLLAIPCALVCAFLVGGLWGALAGWIKAKRGCHEVLTTVLLNFVAYGLVSFFILSVFKDPNSQVPETSAVGAGYVIPPMSWLGGESPLNWSLLLAIGALAVYAFVLQYTRFGFYLRITGSAPGAGLRAGINLDLQTILAMFVSGGIAAMAAASPVLGYALKAREGFTSNAGFIGIAVALLGRNRPLGILFAGLLFGALYKGALDLDLDTEHVTRDLATVIQALIVISLASQLGLLRLFTRWRSGVKSS